MYLLNSITIDYHAFYEPVVVSDSREALEQYYWEHCCDYGQLVDDKVITFARPRKLDGQFYSITEIKQI